MLQFLLIPLVAFLSSLLTLFSGFGLGSILLPAFALFFPVDLAVAMTAIVHLLNNVFKFSLLGRYAKLRVVLIFGIPAILASFAGAMLLIWLSDFPPLLSYGSHQQYQITPLKLIIAAFMAFFAVLEIHPRWKDLSFDTKYLPAGGLLSGFFGGVSGHQGALRSAFLVRTGLTKEAFLGTNVVIACLVDLIRLAVYMQHFSDVGWKSNQLLIAIATAAAFAGAFLGTKMIQKITLHSIRLIISIFLFLLAGALAFGLL